MAVCTFFCLLLLFLLAEQPGQNLSDLLIRGGSKDSVYLRDLICDLLLIPLGQTPGYNEGLTFSFFLITGHLQDRIYALFLGVSDKAAGIDQNRIRLGLIICKGHAQAAGHTQHFFRIHQILVAAQGHTKQFYIFHIRIFTPD